MRYYTAKRAGLSRTPNEVYRQDMQQLINEEWSNTTTRQSIMEEYPFASFEFREIDVQLVHALDKSTSKKQGENFREIIFKDIDYVTNLGNYYKFDASYWLVVNTDQNDIISKNVIVRRCNNFLKWKDYNGDIHEHPCVLEYEATANSPRVDNDIITPNNRVALIVQANEDTLSLKVNHRFIFGGRPFKIIGFNNYQIEHINGKEKIMYIQTQLDEESPYDDFENDIAYNTNTEPIADPEPPVYETGIYVEPMFDYVRQNYTAQFEANLYI